jgi:hypothetical protein
MSLLKPSSNPIAEVNFDRSWRRIEGSFEKLTTALNFVRSKVAEPGLALRIRSTNRVNFAILLDKAWAAREFWLIIPSIEVRFC